MAASTAREASATEVPCHNGPVTSAAGMRRRDVARLTEDMHDLMLVLARTVTDNGDRVSFDDLLAAYGLTRDQLAAVADDED